MTRWGPDGLSATPVERRVRTVPDHVVTSADAGTRPPLWSGRTALTVIARPPVQMEWRTRR